MPSRPPCPTGDRAMLRLAVAFAAVFFLGSHFAAGCAAGDSISSGSCTSDTDCTGNQRCEAGTCVADDVASSEGDGQGGGVLESEGSTAEDTDATPTRPGGENTPDASRPDDYLETCTRNEDCTSGPCVATPLGRVCTRFCSEDEECEGAAGWTCQLVNAGRDLIEVCYPEVNTLCEPCNDDSACPGLQNRCVALLNGLFCGVDCRGDAQCPDGYRCNDFGDGVEQCIPVEERCGACREADLSTSLQHCGECDNVCAFPNAVPICESGQCRIDACDPGRGNCDFEDGSGCETDLRTNPEHCGSCGNACADEPCINGTCGCPEGRLFCDGECRTPNVCGGCENLEGRQPGDACGPCGEDLYTCVDGAMVCDGQTAFNACGGCDPLEGEIGDPCGPCGLDALECGAGLLVCGGETWRNPCGTCEDLGPLAPGEPCGPCGLDEYVCDGESTVCGGETFTNVCDGCSTLTRDVGEACGRCNAGQLVCDGTDAVQCAGEPDLQTSREHCGACDNPCTGGRACVDGACRCPAGEVFCNGACQPDNGCGGCAAIPEPGTTCGTCNNGTRVCNGFNEVICQGAQTNPCGGCNLIEAVLGETCQSCGQFVCSGDQVICQGGANLQADRNNCGQCGLSCPAAQNCVNGTCGCPNSGESLCSGQCVNTQADRNNCGQCGLSCQGAQNCVNGTCACPNAGEVLCAGQCVNTLTSNANCGQCGQTCPAGTSCVNGTCQCPGANERLCGGQCIDTRSDPNNCGDCGNRCRGDLQCINGSCGCPGILSRCGNRCYDFFASCGQCDNGRLICIPLLNILECTDTTNACGGCENASTRFRNANCGGNDIGCATWQCQGGTEVFCQLGCPSGYNCEWNNRCERP